jgi:acyl-CoA synthetase (AMP-forming)/AMP-acid ligase II/acyl carrier protein
MISLAKSIIDVLRKQAKAHPDAQAIFGIDQDASTYQQLFGQAQDTIAVLHSKGIGPSDPVAIVLPNGPLMAAAFLSIASGAASAPLNPNYTAGEYEFYLKDLDAKAVILESGFDNPVRDVAHKLHIPILYLEAIADEAAGLFHFVGHDKPAVPVSVQEAKPSDNALILHTSGTTSRPKMVPLTQKNLCTSASNIAAALKLNASDRCLNIMPLFHIHGLMAAVLASVMAGGNVVCTPGFYAPRFYQWVEQFQPTWYTAVPTMHQSILNRAKENADIINQSSLRFIRSSSASLPPSVMAEIEMTFGAPVIEAYGMTEAAHQMASNPLPPGVRKPGSVGLPAGPEIAIMDEDRPRFLPPHECGEIVIRGDNVTLGYLNNPEENQVSFSSGWFRTGDQGYLDDDGYLLITGRLKEIINRGGEKISPREVDEVLMEHSAVSQAVTFGIPDVQLGEDVAAVIVLRDKSVGELAIKQFVAARLAPHKVPRKIIFVDEIPKGPTGKLQRIGLAEKLGFTKGEAEKQKIKVEYQQPKTDIEKIISEIWEANLNVVQIGINDQFRDVGGDSMIATLIHAEIEARMGIGIDLIELYGASTISAQAQLVEMRLSDSNK